MKLLAGIVIGIIIALSASTTYAQYQYKRFTWVDNDLNGVDIFWDDAEKTNCYIFYLKGGISCVRSMHYKD